MKAYKGFDPDMKCRGFQYEEGKTYETDEAVLCEKGFHACLDPMDVLSYYPFCTNGRPNKFHEVEVEDVCEETSENDTKICGKKITIGAELDIAGFVKAKIEYVKSHTTCEHTDPEQATAGDRGAATAGDRGAATAGDRGAATAGNYGAATAGDGGAATAGDGGAATSKGRAEVGENGIACARGNGCAVKGGLGAVLVIAEEGSDTYDILEWKAFVIDGKKYKPDTWYCLKDGKVVEQK